MDSCLRVLIVEDSEDDMLLVLRELRRGGYTLDYMRVDTAVAMQISLQQQEWDIVIADYTLPTFSAPEALNLLQSQKRDLPFIIVSGTIGEETAVAAMKAGAHDYLTKNNLARLIPAVERELREAQQRQQRHKAEQALRESEERFRQLAENITESVFWMSDPQAGQILYVSPAYERIWGRSCKRLYADFGEWVEAIHPQDRQRIQATFFEQALTGHYDQEYRIIRSDGSLRWIRDRGFPINNDSGQPYRTVGIAEDITNRKLAEQALRQSQHQYQMLAEASPVGIFRTDAEGNYIYVNGRWCEMTGISFDQALGTDWSRALHPDDRTSVLTAWQQATQHNLPFQLEFRFQRFDQTTIWVFAQALAEQRQGEEISGYVGTLTDITGRKQAEQKIREQAALINIASDAIFVRDLANRIIFWNQGAERLYGWSGEEVLGKNASTILYRELSPRIGEVLQVVFEQGEWQGELHKVKKSGDAVIVATRLTLVRDESGQPQSILSVDTDITEKKQLEAQFLRAQRMESLGTLASGIAHDFNNILTPILTAAQLLPLKLPNLDQQSQHMLKLIEDSTKRGADLVKQILAFARGVEGKRVPLQVRHLLSEVMQVARQTFPKAIEIHRNIPAADLWTVSADATQLHQVFMNLCVNARDAMPNGGILSLSAENVCVDEAYTRVNLEAHIGSYVAVTISDTGVGIPEKLLERIFDPFFTTKEMGKGTGLGLSTVLGIVKNHGGFIKVQSQVGQGTEFKVYLPAIDETIAVQSEEELLFAGLQELVLIVDDEPLIRQVTSAALVAHNYKTLLASNGMEAIALYAEHSHDINVVLMDIMMPSMDGLTAIRTLQQLNPTVKIIATSGLASNSQLTEESGIKVTAFLSKPYTAKELLDTLQKVLTAPA